MVGGALVGEVEGDLRPGIGARRASGGLSGPFRPLAGEEGFDRADIYRLSLDGSGRMERITRFADVPTYRASNPVVSNDGRYMAFQMGRSGVAAGTGYGIFLYDFERPAGAGGR